MASNIDPTELIDRADEARSQAYNPYSDFSVGAAVETVDGDVFLGCNVENAAYTPTTHAEQNALTTAIAEGHRDFVQMAIVTTGRQNVPPCGFCRQVIREFCSDDFPIHVGTEGGHETYRLGTILPHSFGPENLSAQE